MGMIAQVAFSRPPFLSAQLAQVWILGTPLFYNHRDAWPKAKGQGATQLVAAVEGQT